MRTPVFVLVGLAISCGSNSKPEPEPEPGPEVVLGEQPIIKDGVRNSYTIELDASASKPAALEQAVRVIRMRLQRAQISGHVAIDNDKVVVDLAGTNDSIWRAGELIAPTGHVVVHVAEPGSPFMTALAAHVTVDVEAARDRITQTEDHWASVDGKRFADPSLQAEDRSQDVTIERATELGCRRGPTTARGSMTCLVTGCAAIQSYVAALGARDARFAIPADHAIVCERLRRTPGMRQLAWRSLFVQRTPAIDAVIRRATIGHDSEWHPRIWLQLDAAGTKALVAATKHRVGARLVIAIDGLAVGAPIIDGKFDDGRVWFTVADGRSDEENAEKARDLAIVLANGPLPGHLVLETRGRLVDGVPHYEE
jgi:preprotein translocase subunit SecD